MLHQVTGYAGQQIITDTVNIMEYKSQGGNRVFKAFFSEDQTKEYSQEECEYSSATRRKNVSQYITNKT